jgi:hypothetical protein
MSFFMGCSSPLSAWISYISVRKEGFLPGTGNGAINLENAMTEITIPRKPKGREGSARLSASERITAAVKFGPRVGRAWVGLLLGSITAVQGALAAGTDPTQPGPWLVFDFSLGWGMGPVGTEQPGGVRFEVQASDGGPFQRLFRAHYARLRWCPWAVNLAQYAGREVRFRFVVEHIEGRIMMDYPHWGNPRIVVGPLAGEAPPREVFNFALTPMDRAGALLPDGTEVPLTEKDPIFYEGLVTPGRLNRGLMLLVYAGDRYICVPGKQQPGLYMGVSMSVDSLRIGAGPDRQPWIGQMPPPVFAEWKVKVPPRPATGGPPYGGTTNQVHLPPRPATGGPPYGGTTNQVSLARVAPESRIPNPESRLFHEIQHRLDVYKYRPGLVARYDPDRLAMEVNMGPQTDLGWAFVGVETLGLTEVPLAIETTGQLATRDENSFAGLLVDYHTPRGYQKRQWFGLGAGSRERYDLRPADWILDGPGAFRLLQRLAFRCEFADLSATRRNGTTVPDYKRPITRDTPPDSVTRHSSLVTRHSLRLPLTPYAPPDWDGRFWLGVGVQNQPQGAGLKVRLEGLKSATANPAATNLAQQTHQFVVLEDPFVRFAVSRTNGAICGGWDQATGRRLLVNCHDRYVVESESDLLRTTELLDRVQKIERKRMDGREAVVVICQNVALPDLVIEKRYSLRPGRGLSKQVVFSTSDPVGFFLHYDAETRLDEKFLAESSRGGALAEKKGEGRVWLHHPRFQPDHPERRSERRAPTWHLNLRRLIPFSVRNDLLWRAEVSASARAAAETAALQKYHF